MRDRLVGDGVVAVAVEEVVVVGRLRVDGRTNYPIDANGLRRRESESIRHGRRILPVEPHVVSRLLVQDLEEVGRGAPPEGVRRRNRPPAAARVAAPLARPLPDDDGAVLARRAVGVHGDLEGAAELELEGQLVVPAGPRRGRGRRGGGGRGRRRRHEANGEVRRRGVEEARRLDDGVALQTALAARAPGVDHGLGLVHRPAVAEVLPDRDLEDAVVAEAGGAQALVRRRFLGAALAAGLPRDADLLALAGGALEDERGVEGVRVLGVGADVEERGYREELGQDVQGVLLDPLLRRLGDAGGHGLRSAAASFGFVFAIAAVVVAAAAVVVAAAAVAFAAAFAAAAATPAANVAAAAAAPAPETIAAAASLGHRTKSGSSLPAAAETAAAGSERGRRARSSHTTTTTAAAAACATATTTTAAATTTTATTATSSSRSIDPERVQVVSVERRDVQSANSHPKSSAGSEFQNLFEDGAELQPIRTCLIRLRNLVPSLVDVPIQPQDVLEQRQSSVHGGGNQKLVRRLDPPRGPRV